MTALRKISLILGGTRSGKSRYGEELVAQSGLDKMYLATGQAGDEEMRARIEAHQARRDGDWTLVETRVALLDELRVESREGRAILVDCLTLWLSNLMMEELDVTVEIEALADGLGGLAGPVVFVSNEVGLGLVPENKLGREFRDLQGVLNQRIAAVADSVVFVAAGLPLVLK